MQAARDTPAVCRQALLAGDYEGAIDCYRRFLDQHPDDGTAYNDLGVALQRLGRYQEALVCYESCVGLTPACADAWYNAGSIHHVQGKVDLAETCYRNAIWADPGHPEAHRDYSMLRLVQGDYSEDVWSSFRRRRDCDGFVATLSRCPAPFWNGEPLAGKTVLVYGEQGLGDEILFASCYPDLIARARHCVIECEPRLEQLFRRAFPTATVIGRHREAELRATYGEIAYKVPCGDLPLHFRRGRDAFPRIAYLSPNPAGVQSWRRALDNLGSALRVGISWRGGTARTFQALRSIELAKWAPLLRTPGVQFVSLQYGDCAEEIEGARQALGVDIRHWPQAIDDYDETAALVCALDLVITVTTSLAHLAGALGQTLWILTSASPRWCYLAEGETMPWYASARLFRQGRPGAWDAVMDQAAAALARRVHEQAGLPGSLA
jgi:tetratricopeptide (TPR) repeat protein